MKLFLTAVLTALFSFSVYSFDERLALNTRDIFKKNPEFLTRFSEEDLYNMMLPELDKQLETNPDYVDLLLQDAMRELLKKPESIQIKTQYDSMDHLKQGKFNMIRVEVIKGHAEDLCIDNAVFTFTNIQLKLTDLFYEKRIKMISSEDICLDAVILENDLNLFLDRKSEKIKVENPHIDIVEDGIVLTGKFKTKFLGVPLKINLWANGNFKIRENSEIHFIPKTIKVNGVGIPNYLKRKVVNTINPVLDFNEYSFNVTLREISASDDKLIFSSGSRE